MTAASKHVKPRSKIRSKVPLISKTYNQHKKHLQAVDFEIFFKCDFRRALAPMALSAYGVIT